MGTIVNGGMLILCVNDALVSSHSSHLDCTSHSQGDNLRAQEYITSKHLWNNATLCLWSSESGLYCPAMRRIQQSHVQSHFGTGGQVCAKWQMEREPWQPRLFLGSRSWMEQHSQHSQWWRPGYGYRTAADWKQERSKEVTQRYCCLVAFLGYQHCRTRIINF